MKTAWTNSSSGGFLPGIKLPEDPKILSTLPSDDPPYDWKHDELVLGVWLDGSVALCKYDEEGDCCLSVDGSRNFSQEVGNPWWFIPLRGAPIASVS